MQKKILSMHEHYDFLDLQGNKLGEADGNLVQVPPKFQVKDTHGQELLAVQGKVFSLRHEFTFHGQGGEELGTIKKKIVKLGRRRILGGKKRARIHAHLRRLHRTRIPIRSRGAAGGFCPQEMGNPKRPTRSINNRTSGPPNNHRSRNRNRTHRSNRKTILIRLRDREHSILRDNEKHQTIKEVTGRKLPNYQFYPTSSIT